jgi:hypothetical protein
MQIIKHGNPQKTKDEFHFFCKNCGCEWYADRKDDGLRISPPGFAFLVCMECPNCKKETNAM